ncbi:MAG: N-6 DNA methylase [Candidatus Diapherotrites archaeon]|nr:N-6 DNA methylase [Candidatus Diapherotrites archaeon]
MVPKTNIRKRNLNNHRDKLINANSIIQLQKNFPIDQIEAGLITFFLEANNILKPKNKLILDMLKKIDSENYSKLKKQLPYDANQITLKNIERIFELLIEAKDRKLNGAFYTPEFIINYINNQTIKKHNLIVCDCSCGSGAFLVLATEKLAKLGKKPIIEIIENNIFGVDILESNVNRTKTILSLLALENGEDKEEIIFNIKLGDSLDPNTFNWKKEFPEVFDKNGGFDTIIGNPPYVRIQNLQENVRNKISSNWATASTGNVDLFIPFFELGIQLLNKNGSLGYITPNSYFASLAGKQLRKFLQTKNLIRQIVNFNHLQIFQDVSTYTSITILNKKNKESFDYALIENINKFTKGTFTFSPIVTKALNPEKWNLLMHEDQMKIKKIEEIGEPLGKIARISVGIATLKDNLYLLDSSKLEKDCYIKYSNETKYVIEKGITKEIIKASIVKNEQDIIKNKRRIIFPYQKIGKKYRALPEHELAKIFPNCYKYFLSIKDELAKRDKGKNNITPWYIYGRSQGIDNSFGEKIITPNIANSPNYILCTKKDALFYAGYSIFYSGDKEVLIKILNSSIMDYYIKKTSKDYRGGYKSFAKTFIKNFGIPRLTNHDLAFLSEEQSKDKIDNYLENLYFNSKNSTKKQNMQLTIACF